MCRYGGVMAMSLGTRDRGSNQTMPKMLIVLVVLLMVLEAPVFSTARFMTVDFHAPTRGLSVDLMHVHHVDSPYVQLDLRTMKRVQMTVYSSKQRTDYFAQKTTGRQTTFGVEYDFVSQVYSVQGSYIMQISVGTPARTFSAVADTGSDLVWLQCAPCDNCFQQPDPVFDPTESSSYGLVGCKNTLCDTLPPQDRSCSSNKTCLYSYVYGDQSFTKGALATESFTLTSTNGSTQSFPNVNFGCGTATKGAFHNTDGLVGLGRGNLSLVSQLGSNFGNIFSYCLVDFFSAVNKTSPLILGGTGTATLAYTPLIVDTLIKTFYYINLTGITVNSKTVKFPSGTFAITNGRGGMILDSGTTITHMFDQAYNPFRDAIAAAITYPTADLPEVGLDLCYNVTGVSNPIFPKVVFQFENLDLELPTANTFIEADDQGTTACLAFGATRGGPDTTVSVYGSIQQQNFQVAYDLAKNRVGFAPATC